MKGANAIRPMVWAWCESSSTSGRLGRALHGGLFALIVLNVVAVVAESMPEVANRYRAFFRGFETFSVLIFSVEYAVRLWACTADGRYAHPLLGRVRYALSPMALIDLAAILPFYAAALNADLRVMRLLRLLRLGRIAKIGRYSDAAAILFKVLRAKREEMILTFSLVFLLGILFATLAFYAEHEAQPRAFRDIPHAMWWAFVTITTVGYGDVAPVTPLGKIIGICTAILGILMIALPTGVLGAAFVEELNRSQKKQTRVCPHCGKTLDQESD
ncbi:MAG: ion transporter [Kiritimatiellae bacterium]|nr:ion transporter [Kiritimatiellia bacterium]MDW8459102.1 ion transporter [Verrucomicrobiota bacterium]